MNNAVRIIYNTLVEYVHGQMLGGGCVKEKIKELQQRVMDLQKRFPAHSIKPAMIVELEELEAELVKLQEEAQKQQSVELEPI